MLGRSDRDDAQVIALVDDRALDLGALAAAIARFAASLTSETDWLAWAMVRSGPLTLLTNK